MAVYHLRAKIISRSKSERGAVESAAYRSGGNYSVMAAAAYRAGESLQDDKNGVRHDYTAKKHIEYTEILLPESAPSWMADREQLWNAVEACEKRKDAQLAREIEISLPRELKPGERADLVREFASEHFVQKEMIADIAIHNPKASDGEEQPHAHILLSTRTVDENGFGKKERAWNEHELVKHWRAAWADKANEALEAAGHDARIDHRSLKEQREEALQQGDILRAAELEREPQISRGVSVNYVKAAKGASLARAEEFDQRIERNELRSQMMRAHMRGHLHGSNDNPQEAQKQMLVYAHSRGRSVQELAAELWGHEHAKSFGHSHPYAQEQDL